MPARSPAPAKPARSVLDLARERRAAGWFRKGWRWRPFLIFKESARLAFLTQALPLLSLHKTSRLCSAYRTQIKGKVKSGKYVRRNLLCGLLGKEPSGLEDLNTQLKPWGWNGGQQMEHETNHEQPVSRGAIERALIINSATDRLSVRRRGTARRLKTLKELKNRIR